TNTRMWLRDAVDHDRLPTLQQLDDPKWFPYRYGQALWAYMSGRFGHDLAARALASDAKGGALGRLTSVTGVNADTLSRGWHAARPAGGSRWRRCSADAPCSRSSTCPADRFGANACLPISIRFSRRRGRRTAAGSCSRRSAAAAAICINTISKMTGCAG